MDEWMNATTLVRGDWLISYYCTSYSSSDGIWQIQQQQHKNPTTIKKCQHDAPRKNTVNSPDPTQPNPTREATSITTIFFLRAIIYPSPPALSNSFSTLSKFPHIITYHFIINNKDNLFRASRFSWSISKVESNSQKWRNTECKTPLISSLGLASVYSPLWRLAS